MIELLGTATVVLFLDQWTKRLVKTHLTSGAISWHPVLRLNLVTTRRKAYARRTVQTSLVILWLAAVASAAILSAAKLQSPLALVGIGATLGGAAGNLADILRRKSVTDFIDFRWWPAFNLADAAIVGGLALAFLPIR